MICDIVCTYNTHTHTHTLPLSLSLSPPLFRKMAQNLNLKNVFLNSWPLIRVDLLAASGGTSHLIAANNSEPRKGYSAEIRPRHDYPSTLWGLGCPHPSNVMGAHENVSRSISSHGGASSVRTNFLHVHALNPKPYNHVCFIK